jgi:hypothetical protein
MTDPTPIDLTRLIYILLIFMGSAALLAVLLGGWILWRIKRINLPPNADFQTALRATPFVVVLMLDLLDFGLDIFGAPIAWVILGRLGLAPLRGVTMVESIIPGTQPIPLMTLAWIVVRLTKRWPG